MTEFGKIASVCPSCGERGDNPPVLKHRDFAIRQCPRCGLIFQERQPGPAEPDYDNIYPPAPDLETAVREARRQYREITSSLEARGLEGARSVLELGCSYGLLVEQFLNRGWDAAGIDICGNAITWARQRGLNCRHSSLEKYSPERTFDLIVMSHVLEHLPEPLAALRTVKSWLTTRGILYVRVPNVDSRLLRWSKTMFIGHLKPLEHLQYFTPTTLRSLLVQAGFVPAIAACGRNTLADVVNNHLRRRLVLNHRWLGYNYRHPAAGKPAYYFLRHQYEKFASASLARLPCGPQDREIVALAQAVESCAQT